MVDEYHQMVVMVVEDILEQNQMDMVVVVVVVEVDFVDHLHEVIIVV
jgi:hypothetical protein